jgi:hypothetical protein
VCLLRLCFNNGVSKLDVGAPFVVGMVCALLLVLLECWVIGA